MDFTETGLNCLKCHYRHPDNGNCTATGGFCTAVPTAHCPLIPELKARAEAAEARAEAAEARAEKAEREKDALLKEFAGECGVCLHYEECSKNHYSCCDGGADWEWRGQKEE